MVYNNPRNEVSGNHLRSQGMVKGVADMILLRPSLPPMFLEIKNEKGRQSLAQRDWEFTVDNNDLGDYALIRSLEHAKEVCGWNR